MAKKTKEKRMVLREMTKGEIESLGTSKAILSGWSITGLVVALVLIIIGGILSNVIASTVLLLAGPCLGFAVCLIAVGKGKKLWNSVKDKTEPIKL